MTSFIIVIIVLKTLKILLNADSSFVTLNDGAMLKQSLGN